MYKFIEVKREENIGIIILNRPEKLNAWHKPMKNKLLDALKRFENDKDIRAIILTGAGDKGFCAGQDSEEAETFDPDGAEAWIEGFRVLYGFIRRLSKPIVGAINGVARIGLPGGSAYRCSSWACGYQDGATRDQFRYYD